MKEKINYYTSHSVFSELNEFEFLKLPKCPDQLLQLVHHLVIHEFECKNFNLPKERFYEINLRYVSSMLERINSLQLLLDESLRAVEKRLVSNCRNMSLLYLAFLRQVGIAARLKIAFVPYFLMNGFYMDHTLVEFYDIKLSRWRIVDVLFSAHQNQERYKQVNFCDLQHHDFISTEKAWEMVHLHNEDAAKFGVGFYKQTRGPFAIRNKLMHELVCRIKYEVLPGDLWGYMLFDGPSVSPTDDMQLKCMNELAVALAQDDTDELTHIYENNYALQVPSIVINNNTYSGIVASKVW